LSNEIRFLNEGFDLAFNTMMHDTHNTVHHGIMITICTQLVEESYHHYKLTFDVSYNRFPPGIQRFHPITMDDISPENPIVI